MPAAPAVPIEKVEARESIVTMPRPVAFAPADAQALERTLRARIEGEVRFDAGSRALHATDEAQYRQVLSEGGPKARIRAPVGHAQGVAP